MYYILHPIHYIHTGGSAGAGSRPPHRAEEARAGVQTRNRRHRGGNSSYIVNIVIIIILLLYI
jgi:hypothetical protein